MHRPRVLVVDDNVAFLGKVVALLDGEFEVIGTAEDGASALDAVVQLQPDVAVLDFSIPLLNGIEVAQRLRARNHFVPLVLMTIVEDAEVVRAARSAGVLGYVAKRRMLSDLRAALEYVLAGQPFVSPVFGAECEGLTRAATVR